MSVFPLGHGEFQSYFWEKNRNRIGNHESNHGDGNDGPYYGDGNEEASSEAGTEDGNDESGYKTGKEYFYNTKFLSL